MSKVKCPNCDNVHISNSRYCSFCGEDLGEAILKYLVVNPPSYDSPR